MRLDQARLLADSRLTDAARIIGLYVSELEPVGEPHRLGNDDLAPVLWGIPHPDTVGRHVRLLLVLGYLERTPGGNGAKGTFRWLHPTESSDDSPDEIVGRSDQPTNRSDDSANQPTNRSDDRRVVVVGGSSSSPPISPPSVSDRALEVLTANADLLNGCRGALRDYLERVPIDRQHGYMQTVVTWLQGGLGPPGLLKHADPTTVLATALNELASQHEAGMKNPTGDVRNLRTKVGILLKEPHAPRKRGPRAATTKNATDEPSRRTFAYE